jgi:metal-responsive CopG/Arc/MetJ family transcriptional regulator
MKTSTVNISFNKDLLKQIDAVAREESRSRSELIREAARMYIDQKKKWNDIFKFSKRQVSLLGLEEADIEKEITSYRRRKKK